MAASLESSLSSFRALAFVFPPFARRRLSRRDNANGFLTLILLDGVSDGQNDEATCQADGKPPQFAFDETVRQTQDCRIVENERGGFKADAVLSAIAAFFVLIPQEVHSPSLSFCTYNSVWMPGGQGKPGGNYPGMKCAGSGREGGRWSLEEMTEVKWVTIQMGKRQ